MSVFHGGVMRTDRNVRFPGVGNRLRVGGSVGGARGGQVGVMALTHTNLVHRADAKAAVFATMLWQWDRAAERGLHTTTLVTHAVLHDAALCAVLRARAEERGDELGLHFHGLGGPKFNARYGAQEQAFWLMPREKRLELVAEMAGLFAERFGRAPASVGSYVMDAWTLREVKAAHPSVRTAITNCFEEGVNMFRGNNHNWHLFSDGGPWGPFWPSRANALIPARDAEEAIDVVALPHLNRDMILAVSSRDDLFASHPLNLFRAKINQGAECPYLFRFIDKWMEQAAHNGWSYLNVFVSSPWLTPGHWALGRPEDGRALYEATLDRLAAEQAAGRMAVRTMDDYGRVFREEVRPGDATICHWADVLRPTPKRQMVWVVNSHYRAAIDLNLGGAIVDLRAYDGRREGDMGPETKLLWNGNHPYLASAEHRGGFWNNGHLAELRVGTAKVGLHDRRVRARVTRRAEDGGWEIESEPATYDVGGVSATVVSAWRVDRSGRVRIERRLVALSDAAAEAEITESFGGCFGTTEYPEDLRGVRLIANGAEGAVAGELAFDYRGREVVAEARTVAAEVPQAGVRIALEADGAAGRGGLWEGVLFKPYYRISLSTRIHLNTPSITWLTLAPLTPR